MSNKVLTRRYTCGKYKLRGFAQTPLFLPSKSKGKLLAAAKRGEFDVLVVSEIRAISRRQVEVFVIYDLLQRYGIRLETITEKFEDSAMGRLILSLRAFVAEVERENSYLRFQKSIGSRAFRRRQTFS